MPRITMKNAEQTAICDVRNVWMPHRDAGADIPFRSSDVYGCVFGT